MGNLSKIISGTGILIGLYLILKNSSSTTSIIRTMGTTYTGAVTALQGR